MLFSLLTAIPSLLSGLFGSINGITAAISNAQIAKIQATTQEEQIRATEVVDTLRARRDVMIAESAHSRLNIIMRFLIAFGPALILTKIFVWDKVIGSFYGCSGAGVAAENLGRSCATFNTDVLDPNLWQVVMVVLGFYFLADASATVSRIFAARK